MNRTVPAAPVDGGYGRDVGTAAGIVAVLLTAGFGRGLYPVGEPRGELLQETVLLAWHAILVGLLIHALASMGFRDGARRLAPAPLAAFVVFLALALAGAALAPYGFAGFLLLLELGGCLAVAALAARCGTALLPVAATALLAGAALQGGVCLWQRFGEGLSRPSGTLENPNHLGAWIVAVLLLNLAPCHGSGLADRARAALALPAVAALLLTGSRGALLGLGVGAGYLLVRRWRRLSPRTRVAVVAAVLLATTAIGIRQVQRLREFDPYRYHRLRIWKASAEVFLAAPWTGTGPRQFAAAAENLNFPGGREPFRYDRSFSRTHSDPLRVPCEFGWPAALALFAAAVLAGRAIARRRQDGVGGAWRTAATAALLALGAQSTVENLSERPAIYLLAAALLGALLSERAARAAAATPVTEDLRRRPGLRLALGVVLLAGFAVGDVAPYLAWRNLADLPQGVLDTVRLQRLEHALSLNPLHPEPWLRKAHHLAGDGSAWDLERYALAREAAERAIRLQPADARYRSGLAHVEALACRTLFRDVASRRRAADRFREAEALSRHNPFLPLERAKLLLDMGDPAGARRAAGRALRIEPNAVTARLVLADALLEEGGPGVAARAEQLVREARDLARRWSEAAAAGDYGRALLRLDVRAVDRLTRKIAAHRSAS